MQLKTLTVLAASLALAQANGWGDHTKAPVLDSTTSPAATKPIESRPTGKPSFPVDGGKTSVADETAEESSTWADTDLPVDGGKTDVADKTTSPSVESSTWADTDFPSPTPEKPVEGGKGEPSKPVDGGKTDVADETASSTQSYWGDETSLPVDGGKTDVADETAPSTQTWADETSLPVDGGKTDVADSTAATTSATWGDHSKFPELTTSEETITKTVTKDDGSEITTTEVNTKTITKTVYPTPAETPVSGDEGKPPGGPPAGGPPAAPGGGKGDECGTVTTTVTNVVTVTVPAGGEAKPTGGQFFTKPQGPPPADTTAVDTFSATWQDQATGFQTSAAPAPSQGGYMGVVSQWRSKMGLSPLEQDSKLQNNAQDASNSSGGQLKHKLNPGSMAQVMAPGDADNFESVFVGGWLCELPNTPGLGSSVCNEMSKGWNYAGQTGHAEILTSGKYSKIGCALGDGIWCCDLA